MKSVILLTMTLLFSFQSYSQTKENKSVHWQKLNLETFLKNRIDNFLGLTVNKDKVYSEVSVKIKDKPFNVPNFTFPKTKNKKLTNNSLSEKNNFGEYLLFDKIGLRAPLIANEQVSNVDDGKLQVKFYQYKKRLENELEKSFDLFSKIESVDIKLFFDQSVGKEAVESVKENLLKILPKVGSSKYNVETLNLEFAKAVKPSNEALLLDNLKHLIGPLGLIIATLILSISSFFLFNGYKKLKSKIADQEAAIMTSATTSSGVSTSTSSGGSVTASGGSSLEGSFDPKVRPGSPQLADAISLQEEGVQKMLLYLEKSNDDACSLIKKWISFNSYLSCAALVVLAERLSVEELYQIFSKLSLIERESWISIINKDNVTSDLKAQADIYIGQQVIEAIMDVSGVEDEQLSKVLVELSPEKAAQIAKDDPTLGGVLVNLLSSSYLSEMFTYLQKDEIIHISSLGLEISEEMIEKNKILLLDAINKVKEIKFKNAFSRRIGELMMSLSPLKQEDMIDVLIKDGQLFIIKDVVRNIIPARIIDGLPSDMIKRVTKELSREKKVEYLVTLNEDRRKEFLDSLAKEGTKGREAFDFELKKISENEERNNEIMNRKDTIYDEFITSVRSTINRDVLLKDSVEEFINEWLSSIAESDGNNIHSIAS